MGISDRDSAILKGNWKGLQFHIMRCPTDFLTKIPDLTHIDKTLGLDWKQHRLNCERTDELVYMYTAIYWFYSVSVIRQLCTGAHVCEKASD